jgi:membrane associated rhomboid family serine protease
MDKVALNKIIKAVWPPLIGVMLMTGMFFAEDWGYISVRNWGLRPLDARGLIGIFTMPFLHGSIEHLFNNAVPLLVLGWSLFYFYRSLAWRAIVWIVVCGGVWVWFSGEAGSNHIGASGLVYGLAAFLFLSGILRRYVPLIAISMLVTFLYGSLVWGVLPLQEKVSWEGHLWGAVAGFLMAVYYRPAGPQRPRFEWEDEEDEEVPEEEQYWNQTENRNATLAQNARPYRIVYHIKPKSKVTPLPPSPPADTGPPEDASNTDRD